MGWAKGQTGNPNGRKQVHALIVVDGVLVKRCTKCSRLLPATSEHFSSRRRLVVNDVVLRAQCRSCYLETDRRRIAANPMKHRAAARRCYERKKADYLAANLEWKKKTGYFTRPTVRLSNHLRSYIRRVITSRAKVGSVVPNGAMRWLSYGPEELLAHLERGFLPGMGWHNMQEWHVDHIRPIASFRFENQSDPSFQECWALKNLRPLWAGDNLRKGARLVA